MKLNNFFFPSSYSEKNAIDAVKSLRGLNKACITRSQLDSFYNDGTFYDIIAEIPFLYTIDKELIYRIMPQTLRMMNTCEPISDNIQEINKQYSNDINSLWGFFAATDISHNSNFDEYVSHRDQIIKEHVSGNVFDEWLPALFSRIKFTDSALSQIVNLGQSSTFNKVYEGLCYLERYNKSWSEGGFQLSALSEVSRFEVSDESDTVKQDKHLKRERYFNIPDNIGSQYCFYHMKIKSGNQNWRIHFYPHNARRCIYVAYVGSHLRLG